jgi:hypothetical protein
MKIFFLTCVLPVLLVTNITHAQNLEEISLKKGPKLTGSLNVNTVGYKAFGLPQRRDSFNLFFTTRPNLNLFGFPTSIISNACLKFLDVFSVSRMQCSTKEVVDHSNIR